MGRLTGKIRYNVQERGRKHNGQDRKFDLPALAALINSPAVQEQVEHGDLLGYYGHWMRMKFGLNPPESLVLDGKVVRIEPAVRTKYLRCDDEGNIEHDTEFLDTESGKMAERLFDSKAGGFSSAIFAKPGGFLDVPTKFAGFDYVFEPNFTDNRGYLLDSVDVPATTDELIFDSVMADLNQSHAAFNTIYDSLRSDNAVAAETIARLSETLSKMDEEREELLSICAKHGTVTAGGIAVLDSASAGHVAPMIINRRATDAFIKSGAAFMTGKLVEFEKDPNAKEGDKDPSAEYIKAHFGLTS